MSREKVVAGVLIVVCGLMVAGSVLAANGHAIMREVYGSGGQRVSGGSYILDGTFGEPIASNVIVETGYGLGSGYWWPPSFKVYLPVVLKSDGLSLLDIDAGGV